MLLDGFFGAIALGAGIYCLYGYYMLKVKKEIVKTILLPKGVNEKSCKDLEGYCRDVGKPLLALGIILLLDGCVDLYGCCISSVGILYVIMTAVLCVMLVVFMLKLRKYNQKYFGIN